MKILNKWELKKIEKPEGESAETENKEGEQEDKKVKKKTKKGLVIFGVTAAALGGAGAAAKMYLDSKKDSYSDLNSGDDDVTESAEPEDNSSDEETED